MGTGVEVEIIEVQEEMPKLLFANMYFHDVLSQKKKSVIVCIILL